MFYILCFQCRNLLIVCYNLCLLNQSMSHISPEAYLIAMQLETVTQNLKTKKINLHAIKIPEN